MKFLSSITRGFDQLQSTHLLTVRLHFWCLWTLVYRYSPETQLLSPQLDDFLTFVLYLLLFLLLLLLVWLLISAFRFVFIVLFCFFFFYFSFFSQNEVQFSFHHWWIQGVIFYIGWKISCLVLELYINFDCGQGDVALIKELYYPIYFKYFSTNLL